ASAPSPTSRTTPVRLRTPWSRSSTRSNSGGASSRPCAGASWRACTSAGARRARRPRRRWRGGAADRRPPSSPRPPRRRREGAAEVTLEGVPAYFVKRRPLLIDLLLQVIPARHYRISMGIQTFDEGQLRRMGRLAFGTADTFREVVDAAHARGFTVSADLLF